MKMVIRIVAVMLVTVLAIGVFTTIVGVGARAVRYMTKQNFTIGDAIEWSWDDFAGDVRGAFGTETTDGKPNYIEGNLLVQDVTYLIRH